jgi:MATE family multidrug resistance protein
MGAYWVVGLPLAATLAFWAHLGGVGLWLGISGAAVVLAVSLSFVVYRIDWQKEARKAQERTQATALQGLIPDEEVALLRQEP